MKKYLLFPLLLVLSVTLVFTQSSKTFHSCREVVEAILLTSPYVKTLVQPLNKKSSEAGDNGWDYVLESSPLFNDRDPMYGNSFSADYIYLVRKLSTDKAVPVYTFKIKPANGKLYQLDSSANNWIQRKSDSTLAPVLQSLCK